MRLDLLLFLDMTKRAEQNHFWSLSRPKVRKGGRNLFMSNFFFFLDAKSEFARVLVVGSGAASRAAALRSVIVGAAKFGPETPPPS